MIVISFRRERSGISKVVGTKLHRSQCNILMIGAARKVGCYVTRLVLKYEGRGMIDS